MEDHNQDNLEDSVSDNDIDPVERRNFINKNLREVGEKQLSVKLKQVSWLHRKLDEKKCFVTI